MSTPSLKSPKGPPRQWLSNDQRPSAARRSSEHVASSQADPVDAVPASTDGGATEESKSAPSMTYPIDENLFYSAPSQPLADNPTTEEQDVDETAYQEASIEEVLHPPDFKPFFTLIEDPQSGEHHHPTVLYIFSDDDPELLTNAALEALDTHGQESQHEMPEEHVDERYVILDMAADGKTVTAAASMSRDWQAIQTAITTAPSWGDDTKSEDKGLMLKISGQESIRVRDVKDKRKVGENIDDLVAVFSEKLDSLEEVLGRPQELSTEQRVLD